MRFRIVSLACLVLASTPLAGMAESPPARVAFLGNLLPPEPLAEQARQAFTEGLQALGWTEGKNLTLLQRYSEGREDRAAALVAELIAEQPDVIVAASYQNVKAAREATKIIPIVFVNLSNPIGFGIVASLARPGGNITGITDQTQDLVGKSMQLLQQTRPGISRMAYLGYGGSQYWKATEELSTAAARQLGLTMVMVPVTSTADFDAAFGQIEREQPDALVVSALQIFHENIQRIVNFSIEHRLPTVSFTAPMARDGLLLAYGNDLIASYRPAAAIVDKILKGAKPADIPVEQPTKFHLVVNLKTARAIGIELPSVLLAGADEVIE